MTHVALLEREVSAEAEAARLLNVAQSTLHSWLEGKTGRGGKVHRPVTRQEPKGTSAAVTWAEFVEAGLLHQYGRVPWEWCSSSRGAGRVSDDAVAAISFLRVVVGVVVLGSSRVGAGGSPRSRAQPRRAAAASLP